MMNGSGYNPYVTLARQALEKYIKTGETISPPADLPQEMVEQKAGVFVSIKIDGQPRGCIGTIIPTRENIALEIIQNAINAGTRDPRFYPVKQEELEGLTYSVYLLKEYEEVQSVNELDVNQYGVLVKADEKTGIILPGINEIETPKQQLSMALERAGIQPSEPYRMYRVKVVHYH